MNLGGFFGVPSMGEEVKVVALTVSFTSRISKRRGQVLVLLPREYWDVFRDMGEGA